MNSNETSFDQSLQELGRRLSQGYRRVHMHMAPIVERKIGELVQSEFNAGRDPYGTPWAPLMPSTLRGGRTPPPLTDTHRLRNSMVVTFLGGNLSVRFYEDYFTYLQNGTFQRPTNESMASDFADLRSWMKSKKKKKGPMPQATLDVRMLPRPMIPDNRGMPARWAKVIEDAAKKATERVFG